MITSIRLFESTVYQPRHQSTYEEARDFLLQQAPYALEEGFRPRIWRGVHMQEAPYFLQRQHPSMRQSRNSFNMVNVLVHGGPRWKRYPRREMIGTSSVEGTAVYGMDYVVIMEQGAKVGICPREDFFESFEERLGGLLVPDLNNFMLTAYHRTLPYHEPTTRNLSSTDDDGNKLHCELDELDYGRLVEQLKTIDGQPASYWRDWEKFVDRHDLRTTQRLLKLYRESGMKFSEWLEDHVLDPAAAGMRLTTAEQVPRLKLRELWSEGDRLLVLENHLSELLARVRADK